MSRLELIEKVVESAREVAPLLGELNGAMEDLLDEGELSIKEYDTIQYYYMQLNAEGFMDDLKDVVKSLTRRDA